MVKRDLKAFVTNEALDGAVDSILDGMNDLFKNVATKKDLEKLATKVEVGQLEDKMNRRFDRIEHGLDNVPSRVEFDKLKQCVDTVERVVSVS